MEVMKGKLKAAQMMHGQQRNDEYLQWRKTFTKWTGNEDATMTAKQYGDYRWKTAKTSVNRSMVEFRFGDLDRSGKVNRHKFALLMSHLYMVPDMRPLRIDSRDQPVEVPNSLSPFQKFSDPIGKNAIVEGFALCPELQSDVDWRGALVDRNHRAFSGALHVATRAQLLAAATAQEKSILYGWQWEYNTLADLLDLANVAIESQKTEAAKRIILLSDEVLRIIKSQPVMVRCDEPCKIFGDIHGQFRDLLLLFTKFGFPSTNGGDIETCSYVFNGDWVDRGKRQLEVVILLFSLKILFPSRVWLVRGNHEFEAMNELYGFKKVVVDLFGDAQLAEKVYQKIHEVFSYLPLSAVVANTVLVLHGGIGDGEWGLKDLAAVKRPIKDKDEKGNVVILPDVVLQALWSDPIMSDTTMALGVHKNPQRGGTIKCFGKDKTENFCKRENIQMIVRSHQYVKEGVCFMHSGRLATVFSARNYLSEPGKEPIKNDGGLVLITRDELGFLRFRSKRLLAVNV